MVHENGAQEWCTRVGTRVVHESGHESGARDYMSGAREWCTRVVDESGAQEWCTKVVRESRAREWCTRVREYVSGAREKL